MKNIYHTYITFCNQGAHDELGFMAGYLSSHTTTITSCYRFEIKLLISLKITFSLQLSPGGIYILKKFFNAPYLSLSPTLLTMHLSNCLKLKLVSFSKKCVISLMRLV
jgi:hypothetical protein